MWYLGSFVILLALTAAYGQTTVSVNCEVNVATKSVEFTISGSLQDGGTPGYVSIESCTTEKAIAGGIATFSTGSGGDCPNTDWLTTFQVYITEYQSIRKKGDDFIGVTCILVTSTLTPNVGVSVSSVSTVKSVTDPVYPTATATLTTDAACTTPAPANVVIGTNLYFCLSLDTPFINIFDIKAKRITATASTTTVDLTTNGCAENYDFWPAATSLGTGKLATNFDMFMITATPDVIVNMLFKAYIELCEHNPAAIHCAGYDCSGATEYGRRRRAVTNDSVILEEIEVAANIRVSPYPIDTENEAPAKVSASDGEVCIEKGGFYGLVIFFVLTVVFAISASAFLFIRARKSRKYIDEHRLYEKSHGSHNPSFHG